MSVSESDVRHIAALARLGMSDERVPTLVGELNRILAHMDVLQAVDLSHFESNAANAPGMPLRPDDSLPTALQRAREDFAPSMRDGFFLVPKLETHGSAGSSADSDDAS
ncbi:MAG: Asp-tRNA(Asn)/Glu-tRNA(Gln) amidotransferase subunit GatC [Gemmatimonadaceae bacterium]